MIRPQLRVDATELPDLVNQVNQILVRLQVGAMVQQGLLLDASATVAPTGPPEAGQPNIRAATIIGVITYYHWNGTAWTTF